MSSAITCPFCNTQLTAQAVLRDGDKTRCLRCNEPLPASVTDALPASRPDTPLAAPSYQKPVEANRRVLRYLLAAMGALAACTLLFALWTQADRRARDPKKPEPVPQPPGELAALRFLPPATNVALGIHVADLLNDSDASTLLKDPRPPLLDWTLNLIHAKTALGLADIDHIVVGAAVDASLPTVVLVVQTHKPYSLGDVKKALHPAEPTTHAGQPLYRFSTAPLGEAFLWCRAPRTLIFLWRPESVDKKDLAAIPKGDAVGDNAIPLPLREFIGKRLEKQSLLWLVGDVAPLLKLQAALDALPVPAMKTLPRLPAPWTSLRFAGLSVVNETKKDESPRALTVRGQFQTADFDAAKAIAARLDEVTLPGQLKNTTTLPPPDAADIWTLWQLRLEVDAMRAWLTQGGKR